MPTKLFALACFLALTDFFRVSGAGAADTGTGAPLDLSKFDLTFAEEFDSLSVSAWGPNADAGGSGSRWIAHTPWKGDFGDAHFSDPGRNFPFTIQSGILRIEAHINDDAKWQSGLLSAVDPKGRGFKQTLGYFEVSAKLPPGPGTWPAFWLVGQASPAVKAEIDVFEHYGNDPGHFHAVTHIWARQNGKDVGVAGGEKIVPVAPGSLYDRFNTYGVDVEKDWVIFYFNRQEVWRTPTPPEYLVPFYPLVNLALGSGWPIDRVPNPSFMYVDYIRAYQRKAE